MSTRSFIAMEIEGNPRRYRGIYAHWDGYVSHNGVILQRCYRDPDKIRQLLDLGSISILAPEIGQKQDFNHHINGWCLAYSRDRGEKDTEANEFMSFSEMRECAVNSWAEYLYIWDGQEWLVQKLNHSIFPEPFMTIPEGLRAEKLEYGQLLYDFRKWGFGAQYYHLNGSG